jgi:FtsP/CotA-like multicopper oxidase with cupredoxin domain
MSPRLRLAAACTIAAALAITYVALGSSSGRTAPADAATSTTPADTATAAVPPTTRTYFIAADEVEWDYAPLGHNGITGGPFGDQENTFVANGPDRIGSVYRKALYREYTDASFRTLKPRPAADAYLGFLGPVIHAQVGDTLKIVFRNNTRFAASMHPHNVLYDKKSEGAPYADGTGPASKGDDAVAPGSTYTYTWKVPERAGPGPGDGSSVMSMYHSHTDEVGDTYSGLIGPMVITRAGMAKADGSPIDVDREVFNMFEVADENQSLYLKRNIREHAGDPASVDPDDDDFHESNLMHSINGYVYGTGPKLVLNTGQRVRWYLLGMGTEVDLHTPHWHGNTLTTSMGMRMDMADLLPGSMLVMNMIPDNPGTWLYHCHVNDHILAGMMMTYDVR